MKNFYKLTAVLTAVLMLTAGCGTAGEQQPSIANQTPSPANISVTEAPKKEVPVNENGPLIPTRIEDIPDGGTIPQSAAARTAVPDQITPAMLQGEWVLTTEDLKSFPTITIPDREEGTSEAYCFPKTLSLFPAWATPNGLTSPQYFAQNHADSIVFDNYVFNGDYLNLPYVGLTEPDPDTFGLAIESLGYSFGGAYFEIIPKESGMKGYRLSFDRFDYYNRLLYTVDGNTLAVGLTMQMPDDKDKEDKAVDITEVDYTMEWSDYHLTLHYGDATAVYVPKQMESTGFSLYKAGVSESEPFEGLTGLHYYNGMGSASALDSPEVQIMRGFHEGYLDTEMQFREDGTFSCKLLNGEMMQGTYLYSGDAMTLTSEGQTATYSIYTPAVQSPNSTAVTTFMIGDTKIPFRDGLRMSWLTDHTFQVSADLNQKIGSCEISADIPVEWGTGSFTVRAVNPYENPVSLSDCYIAYLRFDDPTGFVSDGVVTIGQSTYDQTNFIYDAPYEQGENTLRYKALFMSIEQEPDEAAVNGQTGAQKLDIKGAERIYEFDENHILREVRVEIPTLLYNGLQDNVVHEQLIKMSPTMMQNVINVRNDMLHQLAAAFNNATISVSLDQATGETTMDNSVLFAVDSYELTPEGKHYLDEFIHVYADVLTSDQNKDHVTEVHFEGHTDSSGSYEYNLELSQKRAEAVMDYCLNSPDNGLTDAQREILRKVSTATGYSYSDPILDEHDREDAAASRRAAVKFFVSA